MDLQASWEWAEEYKDEVAHCALFLELRRLLSVEQARTDDLHNGCIVIMRRLEALEKLREVYSNKARLNAKSRTGLRKRIAELESHERMQSERPDITECGKCGIWFTKGQKHECAAEQPEEMSARAHDMQPEDSAGPAPLLCEQPEDPMVEMAEEMIDGMCGEQPDRETPDCKTCEYSHRDQLGTLWCDRTGGWPKPNNKTCAWTRLLTTEDLG